MISRMMARPAWLWHKDLQFIKSVSQQLEERSKGPSEKQAKVIRDIYRRWQKNQEARIYRG